MIELSFKVDTADLEVVKAGVRMYLDMVSDYAMKRDAQRGEIAEKILPSLPLLISLFLGKSGSPGPLGGFEGVLGDRGGDHAIVDAIASYMKRGDREAKNVNDLLADLISGLDPLKAAALVDAIASALEGCSGAGADTRSGETDKGT